MLAGKPSALLEIKCPVKGTVGSNPTLSAIEIKASSVFARSLDFFITENSVRQQVNSKRAAAHVLSVRLSF